MSSRPAQPKQIAAGGSSAQNSTAGGDNSNAAAGVGAQTPGTATASGPTAKQRQLPIPIIMPNKNANRATGSGSIVTAAPSSSPAIATAAPIAIAKSSSINSTENTTADTPGTNQAASSDWQASRAAALKGMPIPIVFRKTPGGTTLQAQVQAQAAKPASTATSPSGSAPAAIQPTVPKVKGLVPLPNKAAMPIPMLSAKTKQTGSNIQPVIGNASNQGKPNQAQSSPKGETASAHQATQYRGVLLRTRDKKYLAVAEMPSDHKHNPGKPVIVGIFDNSKAAIAMRDHVMIGLHGAQANLIMPADTYSVDGVAMAMTKARAFSVAAELALYPALFSKVVENCQAAKIDCSPEKVKAASHHMTQHTLAALTNTTNGNGAAGGSKPGVAAAANGAKGAENSPGKAQSTRIETTKVAAQKTGVKPPAGAASGGTSSGAVKQGGSGGATTAGAAQKNGAPGVLAFLNGLTDAQQWILSVAMQGLQPQTQQAAQQSQAAQTAQASQPASGQQNTAQATTASAAAPASSQAALQNTLQSRLHKALHQVIAARTQQGNAQAPVSQPAGPSENPVVLPDGVLQALIAMQMQSQAHAANYLRDNQQNTQVQNLGAILQAMQQRAQAQAKGSGGAQQAQQPPTQNALATAIANATAQTQQPASGQAAQQARPLTPQLPAPAKTPTPPPQAATQATQAQVFHQLLRVFQQHPGMQQLLLRQHQQQQANAALHGGQGSGAVTGGRPNGSAASLAAIKHWTSFSRQGTGTQMPTGVRKLDDGPNKGKWEVKHRFYNASGHIKPVTFGFYATEDEAKTVHDCAALAVPSSLLYRAPEHYSVSQVMNLVRGVINKHHATSSNFSDVERVCREAQQNAVRSGARYPIASSKPVPVPAPQPAEPFVRVTITVGMGQDGTDYVTLLIQVVPEEKPQIAAAGNVSAAATAASLPQAIANAMLASQSASVAPPPRRPYKPIAKMQVDAPPPKPRMLDKFSVEEFNRIWKHAAQQAHNHYGVLITKNDKDEIRFEARIPFNNTPWIVSEHSDVNHAARAHDAAAIAVFGRAALPYLNKPVTEYFFNEVYKAFSSFAERYQWPKSKLMPFVVAQAASCGINPPRDKMGKPILPAELKALEGLKQAVDNPAAMVPFKKQNRKKLPAVAPNLAPAPSPPPQSDAVTDDVQPMEVDETDADVAFTALNASSGARANVRATIQLSQALEMNVGPLIPAPNSARINDADGMPTRTGKTTNASSKSTHFVGVWRDLGGSMQGLCCAKQCVPTGQAKTPNIYLVVGYYRTPEDAARDRDRAGIAMQSNPRLNFPNEYHTKEQILQVVQPMIDAQRKALAPNIDQVVERHIAKYLAMLEKALQREAAIRVLTVSTELREGVSAELKVARMGDEDMVQLELKATELISLSITVLERPAADPAALQLAAPPAKPVSFHRAELARLLHERARTPPVGTSNKRKATGVVLLDQTPSPEKATGSPADQQAQQYVRRVKRKPSYPLLQGEKSGVEAYNAGAALKPGERSQKKISIHSMSDEEEEMEVEENEQLAENSAMLSAQEKEEWEMHRQSVRARGVLPAALPPGSEMIGVNEEPDPHNPGGVLYVAKVSASTKDGRAQYITVGKETDADEAAKIRDLAALSIGNAAMPRLNYDADLYTLSQVEALIAALIDDYPSLIDTSMIMPGLKNAARHGVRNDLALDHPFYTGKQIKSHKLKVDAETRAAVAAAAAARQRAANQAQASNMNNIVAGNAAAAKPAGSVLQLQPYPAPLDLTQPYNSMQHSHLAQQQQRRQQPQQPIRVHHSPTWGTDMQGRHQGAVNPQYPVSAFADALPGRKRERSPDTPTETSMIPADYVSIGIQKVGGVRLHLIVDPEPRRNRPLVRVHLQPAVVCQVQLAVGPEGARNLKAQGYQTVVETSDVDRAVKRYRAVRQLQPGASNDLLALLADAANIMDEEDMAPARKRGRDQDGTDQPASKHQAIQPWHDSQPHNVYPAGRAGPAGHQQHVMVPYGQHESNRWGGAQRPHPPSAAWGMQAHPPSQQQPWNSHGDESCIATLPEGQRPRLLPRASIEHQVNACEGILRQLRTEAPTALRLAWARLNPTSKPQPQLPAPPQAVGTAVAAALLPAPVQGRGAGDVARGAAASAAGRGTGQTGGRGMPSKPAAGKPARSAFESGSNIFGLNLANDTQPSSSSDSDVSTELSNDSDDPEVQASRAAGQRRRGAAPRGAGTGLGVTKGGVAKRVAQEDIKVIDGIPAPGIPATGLQRVSNTAQRHHSPGPANMNGVFNDSLHKIKSSYQNVLHHHARKQKDTGSDPGTPDKAPTTVMVQTEISHADRQASAKHHPLHTHGSQPIVTTESPAVRLGDAPMQNSTSLTAGRANSGNLQQQQQPRKGPVNQYKPQQSQLGSNAVVGGIQGLGASALKPQPVPFPQPQQGSTSHQTPSAQAPALPVKPPTDTPLSSAMRERLIAEMASLAGKSPSANGNGTANGIGVPKQS